MLSEALAALATSGGTVLAGAIATDAWKVARDGIGRLFGKAGPESRAAVEAQLDTNVALVERSAEPERARQALAPLWQLQFTQLLEDNPELEADLRELVRQVEAALPAQQQQWVQTNVARDNARLFAVQGGNIVYHELSDEDPRG
ncbi:hypothetical protein DFJ67_0288 [Asanoa ferruginea]|uniref:Uncharacterized protein n=1 Tax=Asanoa ferruginea TaxID=53367 RepID=A0A3D9ZBQ8_9ACTN|nr:hypothetical protein [Asanoa ferruginea]REF94369.1 hypothetical protein DFJ67_0288 [Asanoa ferruginea]GIF51115.1 hypothetical protein Afe04nite_56540 [Asanoa ferruginea]